MHYWVHRRRGCYSASEVRWISAHSTSPHSPCFVAAGASGFFGLYGIYYSLQYLSLSDATTLSFIAPILCGLLAYLVLSEPYSLSTFLISLTSLFGVVLIAKPSFLFPDEELDVMIIAGGEVIATGRQRSIAVAVSLIGCCGAAGAYVAIRSIGKTAHA